MRAPDPAVANQLSPPHAWTWSRSTFKAVINHQRKIRVHILHEDALHTGNEQLQLLLKTYNGSSGNSMAKPSLAMSVKPGTEE